MQSTERTEVSAMLDILSMSHYSKAFASKGLSTIQQLLPAVDDPNSDEAFWTKLVTKTQDRNIILGYLSIRKKQDPAEAAKSEQRMHAFRIVKQALMELQDLQLKKAELERGSTVLNRHETTRQEIENILDKIDDTKQKLESAQKSLNASDANKARPLSASYAQKMRSKLSSVATLDTADDVPKSPRVDNESPLRSKVSGKHPRRSSAQAAPAKPELGGSRRLPQTESQSARPSSKCSSSGSCANNTSDFAGTCFSSVRFASHNQEEENTAPSINLRSKQLDVGPGWNRNTPVPRMRQWAAARMTATHFDENSGTPNANPTPFAPTSLYRADTTSAAQPSVTPRGGVSKGRPSSATAVRLPTQQAGFDQGFAVKGVKATSVALGVHLENDHYAQMCCGATSAQQHRR
ncbi:Hypothetical protein, putative [Bodo saltans]|uniref:Uncharacterized protein n=1 Tax=Bodo saltans TaxID=75058 RepID=A0A0S4IWK5_BODSA|nr:Hypothetical protein, putative [Bodo saltans]|eukprot:CUG06058.1 Hypothetical protein, putative [Bodo saltans]